MDQKVVKGNQSNKALKGVSLFKTEKEDLEKDLRDAIRIKQVDCFMQRFYRRLHKAVKHFQKKQSPHVQCQRNCDWCCYLQASATAPEIFYLAHIIRQISSALMVREIMDKLSASALLSVNTNAAEHHNNNIPCGLLDNGVCMAYMARPLACLLQHSTDASICQRDFEQPDRFFETHISDESFSMFGSVVIGCFNHVLSDRGLSTKCYELNQALLQALRNPTLERIWFEGGEPFLKVTSIKQGNDECKITNNVLWP